jgi:hypothetical protein
LAIEVKFISFINLSELEFFMLYVNIYICMISPVLFG